MSEISIKAKTKLTFTFFIREWIFLHQICIAVAYFIQFSYISEQNISLEFNIPVEHQLDFTFLFGLKILFQDVRKMEKFVNNLMRHMASKESN
jgi:hypothetical protein